MSRMSRIGTVIAAVAVIGALLLPVSTAVSAPTAHKSGAIVNYLTTGKIRIKKKLIVPFQCAVTCNVVSFLKLKGPFVKGSDTQSATLAGGQPAGHFLKPSGPLQQVMRSMPGRYKLISRITATDPTTGAVDQIAHTFKLKR
jgi:hypothetical protein